MNKPFFQSNMDCESLLTGIFCWMEDKTIILPSVLIHIALILKNDVPVPDEVKAFASEEALETHAGSPSELLFDWYKYFEHIENANSIFVACQMLVRTGMVRNDVSIEEVINIIFTCIYSIA